MSGERPSRKLLAVLGLSVLLAGGVYGRMLFGGDGAGGPEPDPTSAIPITGDPAATTAETAPWVLPAQPRNPFEAVPLGP